MTAGWAIENFSGMTAEAALPALAHATKLTSAAAKLKRCLAGLTGKTVVPPRPEDRPYFHSIRLNMNPSGFFVPPVGILTSLLCAITEPSGITGIMYLSAVTLSNSSL
jgi:hypothetical protein